MKIAISQPTYLPWLGYFDLMDQVDLFVLLDSVQFEKQSWQQRNRIKTPLGLQWLTVPVCFRGRLEQRIDEVEVRDPGFAAKHLRAIELNYGRSRYFDQYFPSVQNIFRECKESLLVNLNIQFLDWMRKVLGITTPVRCSSSMQVEGKRSELLINLCRLCGADAYVSPPGSAVYLLDDLGRFAEAEIEVHFQNYSHPEYRQLFPPFAPFSSALDLIFNEGPESPKIIRQGRRELLTPSQVPELTSSTADCGKPLAPPKISAPTVVVLRPVTRQDCALLWNWANDPVARKASFSSESIPWFRHTQWFNEKIQDPNCRIFIATNSDGTPVGRVRLDLVQSNSAIVNVNVAPEFRRVGYGSALIKEVVKAAFEQLELKELHAFIKPENEASWRTFERAGFIKTGVEYVGTPRGTTPALHYTRLRNSFREGLPTAPKSKDSDYEITF